MRHQPGTLRDAVAIFSALRGDQVIALLSRLETSDAQELLATAAKQSLTTNELIQAATLLSNELTNEQDPVNPTASLSASCLEFLADLSDSDIKRLLSTVNTGCWAPALKDEPIAIQKIVFDNVAPAIKRILQQEIADFDGDPTIARQSRETIAAANVMKSTRNHQKSARKAA